MRDLSFGNLIRIDPAKPHPFLVDMHHDAGGLFTALVKKRLKNLDNEFHRGVVIIQKKNLIHGRLFRLRLGLDRNVGVGRHCTGVVVFFASINNEGV